MAQLNVNMVLETNDPNKLASILSHHADYIIDFDNNNDILQSVSNVQSYEIGTKHDRTKLSMLSGIIEDILPDDNMPTPEELNNDDDIYEMYRCISTLKQHLAKNGF